MNEELPLSSAAAFPKGKKLKEERTRREMVYEREL